MFFYRFACLSLLFIAIEWLDIKHRTTGAILLSMDWCVFATVLPAVAYFVKDWRHLTATVTAPLLLAMIAWW